MPADATTSVCPTLDEWRDALRGRATNRRWSEFETHLLNCFHCEATVDGLTEQSDTFVRELCRQPSTPADEPEFRALYARLATDASCSRDMVPGPDPIATFPFRLGNYDLLSLLGDGANGSVYLARHVPLDRRVAIKLLRAEHDVESEGVERFVQEVRAIGRLDHPHIVRATDAGTMEGRHYLVMEYVPGVDLSAVVSTVGPLRFPDACEILRQAALGLDYLHDRKFVHRDVKPSNMLLAADGLIKLLDLGLVQFIGDPRPDASQPKPPHGTTDYMAPEQWRSYDHVDGRCDLYSLGCSAYKLLTGRPPFRPLPSGYATKFSAHCEAPIPLVRGERTDVPEVFDRLLSRLMAKCPDQRFTSAAEVADRLESFARGADLRELGRRMGFDPPVATAHRVAAAPKRRGTWTRRELMQAGILAASAGVLGVSLLRRVISPGSRLRSIRDSQWRDLALASPVELPPSRDLSPKDWRQEPNGFITVAATRPVRLHLGQPLVGAFKLAVDLRQTAWPGNAGVFFRYRDSHDEGRDPSYQSIELIRDERDGVASFRLLWSETRIPDPESQPDGIRDLWAEYAVPTPHDVQFRTLAVEVGRQGFPVVSWCGKPLSAERWKISQRGKNRAAVPLARLATEFLGHMGLIAGGSNAPPDTVHADASPRTTEFRRPRMAYLEVPHPEGTRS